MYLKVVFMGTPKFSVPSLDMLIREGYEVSAVITQPDKPKGRGKKLCCPPVKEYAEKQGIYVLQPEKINTAEFISLLKKIAPDILITVAYGKILPKGVLDIPQKGCVNVHASLLPKYRGAAPISWVIINGETKTGITTMLTDSGMDTGDILLKREIDVPNHITAGELHDKLSLLGAEVLKETLEGIKKGTIQRAPQNEAEATYAPMMKKETGSINWERSSKHIHNLIRGTNPWPGAFTSYNGNRVKIWRSEIESQTLKDNDQTIDAAVDTTVEATVEANDIIFGINDHGTMINDSVRIDFSDINPGTIIDKGKNGILVACGKGSIRILELQFDGCRKLCAGECWHNFEVGAKFGS